MSDAALWLPLLAAALSALFTWLAIGYAHRREMLDHPERRRSHAIPTPRGGGVGIVVAALVVLVVVPFLAGHVDAPLRLLALGVGLLAVAGVGAWDDHRPLPALPKLLVHVAAAVLYVAAFGADVLSRSPWLAQAPSLLALGLLAGGLAVLVIVWSINLHNFMDGINGLLAWQAVFVFGALGLVALRSSDAAAAPALFALAAAAAAFLPFNFPRARVFMGDVGSGALGFLLAVAVIPGTQRGNFFAWLILDSAFLIDAAATLASRMAGGRRWYSAHREHLYQWLVRCGGSHARVVGLYALWNVLVALPAALLFVHGSEIYAAGAPTGGLQPPPLWIVAGVYVLGGVVWFAAKRWCRRNYRRLRARHASA